MKALLCLGTPCERQLGPRLPDGGVCHLEAREGPGQPYDCPKKRWHREQAHGVCSSKQTHGGAFPSSVRGEGIGWYC